MSASPDVSGEVLFCICPLYNRGQTPRSQVQEDIANDQMSLKEYIDPFKMEDEEKKKKDKNELESNIRLYDNICF